MMKTYKILSSENEILTFTVSDDDVYTLSRMNGLDEAIIILQAVDTGDGFTFLNKRVQKSMDYDDIDCMHLFLNLIGRISKNLYESYMMLEPIGQI